MPDRSQMDPAVLPPVLPLLRGRTAIVTGSTKGMGRSIAELFSAQGSNVVIIGRNPDEVDVAVREIRER